MNLIKDKFFEGERPLFAANDLRLENIKFYPGESALKEAANIKANNCEFYGKYPFWHNENTFIEDSLFTPYARAAIWYCKNITMKNTKVDAPKMFREIDGLILENVKLTDALECTWYCRDIVFDNVEIGNGDYLFKNC